MILKDTILRKNCSKLYNDINRYFFRRKFDPSSTTFGLNTEKRDFDLVVSFTTFPGRINYAFYVADIMLQQTIKPDKVLLILTKEEFNSIEDLPVEYKKLQNRGLTIVFVDNNLKPHNKYLYAMKQFPDSLVVTVDDDMFYEYTLLEILLESYKNYPRAIISARAHLMDIEGDIIMPYNTWTEFKIPEKPRMQLFATGVGGVLYPPHLMHEDVFDTDKIKQLCLNQDDVWLKIMQVLKGTPVVYVKRKKRLLGIVSHQENALNYENCGKSRNDRYIADCMREYNLNANDFVD